MTKTTHSTSMNKNELEQNKYINTLYSIVDKLEQRISTLEKVLASHAKCIGAIRKICDE
jgi:NAD+--asparagine ADP-ribosyltransferase